MADIRPIRFSEAPLVLLETLLANIGCLNIEPAGEITLLEWTEGKGELYFNDYYLPFPERSEFIS